MVWGDSNVGSKSFVSVVDGSVMSEVNIMPDTPKRTDCSYRRSGRILSEAFGVPKVAQNRLQNGGKACKS